MEARGGDITRYGEPGHELPQRVDLLAWNKPIGDALGYVKRGFGSAFEVMGYLGVQQDEMQHFLDGMTILEAAQSEVLAASRPKPRKPKAA